ncbi:hypothetical protein AAGT00_05585 [Streptomyces cavourensis]
MLAIRQRQCSPQVRRSAQAAQWRASSQAGQATQARRVMSACGSRGEAESGPEAPWEEAGRGVDWEGVNEIRQAGFGLMEAFGQVWKTGSPDQRQKALAVINDARKKLYLILADEH